MKRNKYLITGAAGFVAGYFLDLLFRNEPDARVLAADIAEQLPAHFIQVPYRKLNLLDEADVYSVLNEFKPDYILHLASISSVSESWKRPKFSFINNTNIFLNIVENVRLLDLPCTILSVGSSEEYGNYPIEEMPLQETYQLHPSNPYSVARTAQEMLAELFVNGYGMNIVLTRSFNHIGPWQRDTFVISSFVKQLVECKLSGKPAVLHTGNVEIIRDFLDVRDVVDAYYKLLHNGKNGEVYNICSGEGTRLRTIIETLGKLLDMEVTIQTDPSRIRPTDNLVIIGDNSKLKQAISWDLTHTLTDSLQDMIKYYMEVLAK